MKWYGFKVKYKHDEAGSILYGNWIVTRNFGLFQIVYVVMKGPISSFVRWGR